MSDALLGSSLFSILVTISRVVVLSVNCGGGGGCSRLLAVVAAAAATTAAGHMVMSSSAVRSTVSMLMLAPRVLVRTARRHNRLPSHCRSCC